MISGNLRDMERYTSLGGRIAEAFTVAKKFCQEPPTTGTHQIDGQKLYANVQRYETAPSGSIKWEAHRRYIDLQVVVDGHETIQYNQIDRLTPVTDYDEKDDYQLFEGDGSNISLSAGDFMLLYPEDAHKPRCIDIKSENIVKIVIKILL